MNRFEQTALWQNTLAKQLEADIHERERELLRVQFENFRERARVLAAEISRTLPEFTVHDITHLDALWDTAELVTKGGYNLTPTEAFVLGGTFLIHDLGMGLASFPDGTAGLRNEPIWKDTVASLLKQKLGRSVKEDDFNNLDTSIERIATETILRLLHAKHAEKLASISWKNEKNETLFLIENTELREAYGSIIGLIAHSHWWSTDELIPRLPSMLGAPGIFPSTWTIDPIKIACLLRVADATQIDDRRAPSFLKTIRKPSGIANDHWNFQQKLYQPRLEKDRLMFSSKSSFGIHEVDSWWICYDTLQMIDNELRNVDSLLTDTGRPRLKAIGVASIEDPSRLSKLIGVEGWQPIDTKITISNIPKLVKALGGEQLYGNNSLVPLRELIQNAADAIRARRSIEDEPESFGSIRVSYGEDIDGHYIEVEDNGIGMSSKVLTGPFIDFGQSFWGSSLMHEELPGLEANGFSSTGKYGIGFFSVFMWGEKITVTSKRYDDARVNTLVLEFKKGTTSRPLLKHASPNQYIKDGGTRIRVWLSKPEVFDSITTSDFNKKLKLTEVVASLCPALDCNISVQEKGNKLTLVVEANDWITLPPLDLLKRINGNKVFKKAFSKDAESIEIIAKNLTLIKDEAGNVIGRAAVYKQDYVVNFSAERIYSGTVTVGGFSTSDITGIPGILVGTSHRASRDVGVPIVNNKVLSDWATHQAQLLSNSLLNKPVEVHTDSAAVIRYMGGKTLDLKIASYGKQFVTYNEAVEIIKKSDISEFFMLSDTSFFLHEKYGSTEIELLDNVFVVSMGTPGVLQTRNHHINDRWPDLPWIYQGLESLLIQAFAEAWDVPVDSLIQKGRKHKMNTIGYSGKNELKLDVRVVKRPK